MFIGWNDVYQHSQTGDEILCLNSMIWTELDHKLFLLRGSILLTWANYNPNMDK